MQNLTEHPKCAWVIAALMIAVMALWIVSERGRVQSSLIGVTAECNNGRYTTTPHGARGVCSGNGGVKRWIE